MPQISAWESEYRNPKLITKDSKPQKDVLRYFKFLKKEYSIKWSDIKVLDLGSGVGRNANYLASLGASVCGLEISETALKIARARARDENLSVKYFQRSIGEKFQFEDNFFDLVLDITSSNSLSEKERKTYLRETSRVLKKKGHFLVRALSKDADKNAKALLKNNPGPEKDTYVNRDMNLVERVFSQNDFLEIYSKYFKLIKILKKTGYTRFKNQSYKRNFLLAYLRKM